jgi:putative aldouronate transport system permease protein
MLKRTSPGDRVFYFWLYLFMIFVSLLMLYPFLYIISMSLGASANMGLSLIPKAPTLEGYRKVLANIYIFNGFKATIIRVLLGTTLTIFFTITTAYPLAKRYFPDRSFWTSLLVFTMFFSGGLIPNYLLVRNLGLYNTVWALVLPGLISTYNMIIMRNFFMAIPAELEESARMDGAGEFSILFRIIVPVSGPIIATVILWTMVGHWNAWFDSMIYISTASKQVLQQVLRRMVLEGEMQMIELNQLQSIQEVGVSGAVVTPEGVKAAAVMVATIPIICIYPFLQKYFVKGVLVGSLKG